MDFVQGLDPARLILANTVLSFCLSPFTAPPYNLAIFLFGTYAQENTESVRSLQTFTGILGASALFDVVWMMRHDQNGFIKLLSVILVLLKIPTFLASGLLLRQRGSHFGGLGIRDNDLSGATVWSMPGGFTSAAREGYQTVDEERPAPISRTAAAIPSALPSSHPPAQVPSVPGTYQNV